MSDLTSEHVFVIQAVTTGEWEGVEAIFSAQSDADQFASEHNEKIGYRHYIVQEWAIDDPNWNPYAN